MMLACWALMGGMFLQSMKGVVVSHEWRAAFREQLSHCMSQPPSRPHSQGSQGGGVEADVEQAVLPLRHAASAAAACRVVAEGGIHRHRQLAVSQRAQQHLQGRERVVRKAGCWEEEGAEGVWSGKRKDSRTLRHGRRAGAHPPTAITARAADVTTRARITFNHENALQWHPPHLAEMLRCGGGHLAADACRCCRRCRFVGCCCCLRCRGWRNCPKCQPAGCKQPSSDQLHAAEAGGGSSAVLPPLGAGGPCGGACAAASRAARFTAFGCNCRPVLEELHGCRLAGQGERDGHYRYNLPSVVGAPLIKYRGVDAQDGSRQTPGQIPLPNMGEMGHSTAASKASSTAPHSVQHL